jgi:hypothetical protein
LKLWQQAAGKTRLAVDPQNGNRWQADRSRTSRIVAASSRQDKTGSRPTEWQQVAGGQE